MITKLLKRVWKNQKGITGLETAIILIAFVVVAAVFAYTVLSAGLFSTQKSSEAVYSALDQVSSTIEIKGAVIAKAETTGETGAVSQLTFTVANAMKGSDIDFTPPTGDVLFTGKAAAASNNVIVISYTDEDQRVEDLYWTATPLSGDTDNLLEPGEKFQITVGDAVAGAGFGNFVDALNPDLGINKNFTIEMKTTKGAVLSFERTTPATIDTVINLN